MAQHVAAVACVHDLAVHLDDTFHGREIGPRLAERAEHDALVPRVVRDEGEHVERVRRVAIVDHLERRCDGVHGGRDILHRPRTIARRKIATDAHADLEFQPEVHEFAQWPDDAGMLPPAREHRTRDGMIDAAHRLHPLRGQPDLPADARTVDRNEALHQGVLDGIGRVEIIRAEIACEWNEIAQFAVIAEERIGSDGGVEGHREFSVAETLRS